MNSLLLWILVTPLVGALLVSVVPMAYVRAVALLAGIVTFLFSLGVWLLFDQGTAQFQFVENLTWWHTSNINVYVGVDGISIFFVLLSTMLIPICMLVGWVSVQAYVREFFICLLILDTLIVSVFVMLDLVAFYISFEAVLVPMFLIIGIWGSRERKIRAAYQFFLYTLFGSVLLLLGVIVLYFQAGTTDWTVLSTVPISEKRQLLLWLAFFASFAVKVPMVPVHIWLPEAHVEAPTAGSVLLAGVMLKLGTYGFLRFSIPFFPYATLYFTPLVYTLSVVAIVYASLTTIRQVDLKKIIAYSSVAHMNFVTLGVFALNVQGVEGAILLILSHGFVSSALFLCIGALYDRHKTRLVPYYGGLVHTMPAFSIMFLFFTLGNLSLPGTSSFVGEFLILVGVFQSNTWIATIASTGMVLGAAYSLWLYNRIVFGSLKWPYLTTYSDLNRREILMFLPLVICVLWIGLYPEVFLNTIHCSVSHLITQTNNALL